VDSLRALDSLMRLGLIHSGFQGVWETPLIAARAFEEAGDLEAALAAIRLRVHHETIGMYGATAGREEGRLAQLAGDREGAVRAYQQWLAMHPDPEASVLDEVEQVKAELARLVGEPQNPP
jgi:hypothetical protein